MKRFLISAALVLALSCAGGYAYQALAAGDNGNPPDMPGPGGPPGPCGPGWGPGGMGPGGPGMKFGHHHGPDGWHHEDAAFALFPRVQNKTLTAADVKIIATAILLEHGNHDWTVANIAAQTDKSIDFSFATAHGDVIATFAVDPQTGRIKRLR
jgi:hypothetical protein